MASKANSVKGKSGSRSRSSASKKKKTVSKSSQQIAKAIDGKTRAIFCESIANPGGHVADIPELVTTADSAPSKAANFSCTAH